MKPEQQVAIDVMGTARRHFFLGRHEATRLSARNAANRDRHDAERKSEESGRKREEELSDSRRRSPSNSAGATPARSCKCSAKGSSAREHLSMKRKDCRSRDRVCFFQCTTPR